MNVLSLCDGMSCGQIALKELGIKVDKYYASEIDKNAIKVTQDNFPDTIQLGDVKGITNEVLDTLPKIDLVLFGSPCFAGDTLVLTADGYKKIKEVTKNDKVLGHDNKYHRVLDSACTGIKNIIRIESIGTKIDTTENHKFYVRKRFEKPEWKKVKDLTKEYYLGIAINQNSILPKLDGVSETEIRDKNFWFTLGQRVKNNVGSEAILKPFKDTFPSYVYDLPTDYLKCFLDGLKGVRADSSQIVALNECYVKAYHKPYIVSDSYFYEDNTVWVSIASILPLNEKKEVYDLTVEEVHSFTANGVIVHNCRSLSVCSQTIRNGKDYNNGLKGISGLFVDCVNILDYIKQKNNPEVKFLSENVNVHKKNEKDLQTMSQLIGVSPVLIDSSIFSAQGRLRNYWTNIPLSPLPEESPLVVKDILEENVDDKYYYEQDFDFYGVDKRQAADLHIKGFDLIRRVVSPYFKSYTLTACRGGNTQMKVYDEEKKKVRKFTPLEYRRLQTIPDWYKMNVANSHIYNMCGDGWNIKTICYLLENV